VNYPVRANEELELRATLANLLREMYPAASLTGTGAIERQAVRCISAEWMVKFHSGYDLKDKDFRDVSALCKKFGIDLPPAYEQFTNDAHAGET
jgi:hypothetical protein